MKRNIKPDFKEKGNVWQIFKRNDGFLLFLRKKKERNHDVKNKNNI